MELVPFEQERRKNSRSYFSRVSFVQQEMAEEDFAGQFDDDEDDIDFTQSTKDKIIFINKLTENSTGEEVFEFVEEEEDDDFDEDEDDRFWKYQATLEGNESVTANSKYQSTGHVKEQKFATKFNLEPLHETTNAPSAALGALKEHQKKNNSMVFSK